TLVEQLATLTTGYTPDLEREQQEPTYYDYPVLKTPIWRWEIVWYFFLGGLAAGCYVIASIAALFGSQEDRVVARTGYYLSLLALLPCPPLLIKDLGRPERFLNMLRVFKVKSPMSMGVWGLLTFSMFSGTTAMIQAARDGILGKWWGARWLAKLPQRLLAIPGSFFGIFLGGYTGVLLATTSIPLWSRSKLLGAIFISSAMSTGSALISLILRIVGGPAQTLHKLEQMEWVNMLVELIGLLAFLRSSGRTAHPLVGTAPTEQGMTFWRFMFGGGLIVPWLIQTLLLLGHHSRKTAASQKQKGGVGLVVSALVLVGGYFLRRTVINAGYVSSKDARTTLWNTR
ncbi:MAG TPA: NrfD/PsrC family molybdoenzyme membrane anchor subunit, partial [Ktedonobacteraceae bacterium]|nr:NrfD/PsrC family molybdoenzyme membrane anchor subunit [Ktedonobacteraceae bacterium]